MDSLISDVRSLLKAGYSLKGTTGSAFEILDPKGELVRDSDTGQVVKVYSGKGYHYRRRAVASLARHGVLKPRTRSRTHTPQDFRETPTNNSVRKTPLIIAAEVLKDSKANPRERGLARALIESQDATLRASRLATFLGERVQELEKFIKESLPERG